MVRVLCECVRYLQSEIGCLGSPTARGRRWMYRSQMLQVNTRLLVLNRGRGRDLIHLAQLNEMIILNGLILPWVRADAIVTRVGSNPGDEVGTVMDYLVASEQILRSVTSVTVETDLDFSDHRPVRFRWNGHEAGTSTAPSTPTPEHGPIGWRFKGNPTEK